MTRSAARELFSNTRLQRWCFDVELIYLAGELRIPVVEVPVDWTEIPGEPRTSSLTAVKLHYGSVRASQVIAPLPWQMSH